MPQRNAVGYLAGAASWSASHFWEPKARQPSKEIHLAQQTTIIDAHEQHTGVDAIVPLTYPDCRVMNGILWRRRSAAVWPEIPEGMIYRHRPQRFCTLSQSGKLGSTAGRNFRGYQKLTGILIPLAAMFARTIPPAKRIVYSWHETFLWDLTNKHHNLVVAEGCLVRLRYTAAGQVHDANNAKALIEDIQVVKHYKTVTTSSSSLKGRIDLRLLLL